MQYFGHKNSLHTDECAFLQDSNILDIKHFTGVYLQTNFKLSKMEYDNHAKWVANT